MFITTAPAMAMTTITGTIVDKENKQPIEDDIVFVCRSGKRTTAYCTEVDSITGKFTYKIQDSLAGNLGDLEVVTSLYNIEPLHGPFTIGGENNFGTIELIPLSYELDETIVTGCSGDKANGILRRVQKNNECYVSECVNDGNWKLVGRAGTKDAYCGKLIDCDQYKDFFHANIVKQKNSSYPKSTTPENDYINFCYPTECQTPLYKRKGMGENMQCVSTIGDECRIPHAQSAFYNDQHECIVSQCDKNYEKSDDGKSCNPCKCGTEWNAITSKCEPWTAETGKCNVDHAFSAHKGCEDVPGKTEKKVVCIVDTCADNYKKSDDEKSCEPDIGAPCTPTYSDHANGGELVKRTGKIECKPHCTPMTYEARWIAKDKDYRCIIPKDRVGTTCTEEEIAALKAENQIDEHASAGTVLEWNSESDGKVTKCEITDCDNGYEPSKDGTKCNSTNCTCDKKWDKNINDCVPRTATDNVCGKRTNPALPTNATSGTRTCPDDDPYGKPFCLVSQCDTGYEKSADEKSCKPCECGTTYNASTRKCEPWAENEPCAKLPTNATAAYRDCDKVTKTEFCHVKDCADQYKKSNDEKSCVPDAGTPCTPTDTENAGSGILESRPDGTVACRPVCLLENQEPQWDKTAKDYKCVEKQQRTSNRIGKKSTPEELKYLKENKLIDERATECKITEWDYKTNNPIAGTITKCIDGFEPDILGETCEPVNITGQECPSSWFTEHNIAHVTAGKIEDQNDDGSIAICSVSACESGFEPDRFNNVSHGYPVQCIKATCDKCGEEWDSRTQKCVPWRNTNCTDDSVPKLPTDAKIATKSCYPELGNGKLNPNGTPYCIIKECIVNDGSYVIVGADPNKKCENKVGEECVAGIDKILGENIDESKGAKYTLLNGKLVCKANACISPKYYTKMQPNARGDGFDCVLDPAKDPVAKKQRCDKKDMERLFNETQNKKYEHATGGVVLAWDYIKDQVIECSVTNCANGFDPDETNGCIYKDQTGQKCDLKWFTEHNISTDHMTAAEIAKYDQETGTIIACNVTKCEKGYEPKKSIPYSTECIDTRCPYCGAEWSSAQQKCVQWLASSLSCSAPNAILASRDCTRGAYDPNNPDAYIANDNNEYCKVETCQDGFYHDENANVCVSNKGQDCRTDDGTPHAAVATLKKVKGEFKCIIAACEKGFDLKDNVCVARKTLTEEQYQAERKKLTENAQKMKEKQTSMANRAINAVGIGATGVGTMMVASALSEQAADAEAEAAMRSYLSTFHCGYGSGKNIPAGHTTQR